jgi:NADPH:quinone reductase-like Zn-dependent oxidoreductase
LGNSFDSGGFNLYAQSSDPQWLRRGFEYVLNRLESGALQVVIAKSFPLTQYAEAHRYLESNQQIGRVVVTV